jgi:hypothetical protein
LIVTILATLLGLAARAADTLATNTNATATASTMPTSSIIVIGSKKYHDAKEVVWEIHQRLFEWPFRGRSIAGAGEMMDGRRQDHRRDQTCEI